MSKGLFITGTGTDVGKTYVTALIVKKLRCYGLNAGYYKAALSGAEEKNGVLIPGDAEYVLRTAGLDMDPNECVSYVYRNAYSPHLAAILEGGAVEKEKVMEDYGRLMDTFEYLTVEGSGGIVCPIAYDKNLYLEDIIKMLKLPSLIVADAGLGTINSVVLTVEYMRAHGLPVCGMIFNNFHSGSIMEEDNIKMVEELTGIKVLAKVEKGASELDIDPKMLAELYAEI